MFDLSTEIHWQENFLLLLKDRFTEGRCQYSKNNVPREGVVVVKEGEYFEAFKLKSNEFLSGESEELDKGKENVEDADKEVENPVI